MPVPSPARSRRAYENTKKHLDKLLSIGVIKKEAGLGAPTSKGIHPVWEYSLVPGGLEAIIRNLGLFSNARVQITGSEISRRLDEVKKTLNREVLGDVPGTHRSRGHRRCKSIPVKERDHPYRTDRPGKPHGIRPGRRYRSPWRVIQQSPGCQNPMEGLSAKKMPGSSKTAEVPAEPR